MRSTPSVPGLSALVFAALTGTMAMMSFVAVIGPVVRLLGLSEWHAGLSVTAAGVLWMLSARGWGGLSDRIGRKRVLLITLLAYALIYIVMAVFVDAALRSPPAVWLSVTALVGTRALVGLFYAAVPPTAAALAADSVQAHEQGAAAGAVASVQGLGMVIGPMVGTLSCRVAPPLPYLLVGVLLLALSVTAVVHVRSAS